MNAAASSHVLESIDENAGSVGCASFKAALASVGYLTRECAIATAEAALSVEAKRPYRSVSAARARLVAKRVGRIHGVESILHEAYRRAYPVHGQDCVCDGCSWINGAAQ